MKNLILLIVFTLLSAFLLVIMLVLVFLPKLCSCFNAFCNKNHAKLALQKERAQMIKQVRLKLAYKSQITHEAPGSEELEVSRGIFFDEDSQNKKFDEASLMLYKKELYQNETVQSKIAIDRQICNLQGLIKRIKPRLQSLLEQLLKPVSKLLDHT